MDPIGNLSARGRSLYLPDNLSLLPKLVNFVFVTIPPSLPWCHLPLTQNLTWTRCRVVLNSSYLGLFGYFFPGGSPTFVLPWEGSNYSSRSFNGPNGPKGLKFKRNKTNKSVLLGQGLPTWGEFTPRENKRVARGNGGLPRLGHSFHLIVTGIEFTEV